MSETMRPCPFHDDPNGLFAGQLRVTVSGVGAYDGTDPAPVFRVECLCGASGPRASSRAAAIDAWNMRS